MKKIEIIIDKAYLPKVLPLFDEVKITGYSILDIFKGKGDVNDDTIVSGAVFAAKSMYIISVAEDENATKLAELVSPIIKQGGGVLIISTPDSVLVH